MPSAYDQFRWLCVQRIIAGAAVALLGVTLMFSELRLGSIAVPDHPVLGAAIALGGLLYGLSSLVALRNRRKPAVR